MGVRIRLPTEGKDTIPHKTHDHTLRSVIMALKQTNASGQEASGFRTANMPHAA